MAFISCDLPQKIIFISLVSYTATLTKIPERMFRLGFLTKLIVIATAVLFCFVPYSFGRGGSKLYSIGINASWSSSLSWSFTLNGAASGFVPQSNDTVVVDRGVVLSNNFSFSGNGILEVLNTGILRGDNVNIDFSGSSSLKCSGEIKINNLSLNGNSSLIVETSGKILVRKLSDINSTANHSISGKLSVTGSLTVGALVSINGNGAIESVHYNGNGSAFNIHPASIIPDGSLISEFNWTGNLNSNWGEPKNWAGSSLPLATSNVAILAAAHNPEVTNKALSNNLYINSGSVLIINPEAFIHINGNLSVIGAGKFLLKNTHSKKSSLFLNGDAVGSIQSEYQVLKGQKNLVSSPVEMAYSKTFLNMYLRTYDESSSQWGSYIVPTNDPLQMMQGYELYSLSSETRTFEGTPDHNPKSYSLSNSGNGLNLTGNPFTCYIDWENNDNNAWQRNAIASAIYYPDPSGSGNFSVYLPGGDDAVSLNNGSRYIAPMQGFFVKADTKGSLVVNENSRVSSFNEVSHPVKNNSIKFKLDDGAGFTDEVLLRVLSNSTYGFDDKLDALKIQNTTDAPYICLKSEGNEKYAINSIPDVNSSVSIPLNIECKKAGHFTISNLGGTAFEYRYPVMLEDKELKKYIDLRTDSVYSFYQSPEMNAERFAIHFDSPQGVDEQVISNEISEVTVNTGEVIISGTDKTIYTAMLFSIDGKMISSYKGSLSGGISLSTGNQAAGVCILKLFDGKQTITKKIVTK